MADFKRCANCTRIIWSGQVATVDLKGKQVTKFSDYCDYWCKEEGSRFKRRMNKIAKL